MAIARAMCRCKSCGTDFEAKATKRNRAEADSWERWASDHINECQECRNQRIVAERQEESAKAAAAAREAGFPNLIGSEKQVAWAETIRRDFIGEWDGFIEDLRKSGSIGIGTAEFFKVWILRRDDAKFWIDHRFDFGMPPRTVWKIFKKEYMEEK